MLEIEGRILLEIRDDVAFELCNVVWSTSSEIRSSHAPDKQDLEKTIIEPLSIVENEAVFRRTHGEISRKSEKVAAEHHY